jgi:endonuclease YncB( thermonuclease family)
VTDGDTVRVWAGQYSDHPVRLVGIDAPEKAQPYGSVSRDNLDYLLTSGEQVEIVVQGFDKYDRILADICIDGASLNVQQVAEGMAYTYTVSHIADNSFRGRLEYAQRKAKRAGAGIHGCTDCVTPYEYRKNNPR